MMFWLAVENSFLTSVHGLFAQVLPGDPTVNQPGPRPFDLPSLALAVGTVAVVLLLVMVVSSILSARQRRELNNPRGLLRQLCDAHGFHRGHYRLLLRASRALLLEQPARFFLEPDLLAQALEHPSLASGSDDLKQIVAELFGPGLPA